MLSRAQALELVLAKTPATQQEFVPLLDSLGGICASPIISPVDLPPFDNSAMDGYAAKAADISQASPAHPATLSVVGKVAAGQVFAGDVQAGQCVRIFTGSMLPAGADCVVMQEDTVKTDKDSASVLVSSSCTPWENVRFKGEDVRKDSIILEVGERTNAGSLALLAACGIQQVSVFKKPRVAILSTGTELVRPGNPLASGKIYESNQFMIAGLLASIGIQPSLLPPVSDLEGDLQHAMNAAFLDHDVLITTGGVSVGEFDLVKSSFEQIGGHIEMWRISLKPGKPFAFGTLGLKQLFGLPGNPVSAFVTFLLMCRPALLRMQGASRWELPLQSCLLACDVHNHADRTHYMRVSIDPEGFAIPAGTQASHIIKGLGKTDGLLEVLPKTSLTNGSRVKVFRIPND